MRTLEQLSFSKGFSSLPGHFHARVWPEPLEGAHLAAFNPVAADLIDLDPAEAVRDEFVQVFGGERMLSGMDPVAALYAGHQFGRYVPQLGDGRAILLGEVHNERGEGWELQLKGAGITPYSRDGDGRAVLRSSIREYLCSEAMHGLGIPSTRALALIGSGEEIYRERIESGAILVRMAPSHVRFGSFEVFYHRGEFEALYELADHVIHSHYPELLGKELPYAGLLEAVIKRTARLIAQWQLVGFTHGVMNSDNMSILGLTMDYGPYGFLDAFQPGFMCNHSDHHGRYAFDRQPEIGLWNLSCLAQAMLPLLGPDDVRGAAEQARELLQAYQPEFDLAYAQGMRGKLGLQEEHQKDHELAADLLRRMAANGGADYTRLFRVLGEIDSRGPDADTSARDLFVDREAFDQWVIDYRQRLRAEGSDDVERRVRMQRTNPKYILRNYLAQQAIERAEQGDFSEVERLLHLLQRPCDEQPEFQDYAAEPPDWARGIVLSCSS